MDQCARCGQTLGVGRYCVNCGQPRDGALDDWRTDTAERPAVRPAPTYPPADPPVVPPAAPPGPVAPPPVFQTPPQARYPMYADEPDVPTEHGEPGEPGGPDEPPLLWEAAAEHQERAPQRRRSVLPWVLVAAALVLVAVAGVRLLTSGSDDEAAADPGPITQTTVESPRGTATRAPAPTPTPTPTPTEPPAEPEDVAAAATAAAPTTAAPGRDVDGDPVRYDADNMLDGRDDTAWRAPGDATGATLGFRLAEPTRLTSVGLLNGYAKTDPGYDGYTANRRVLAVEWVFDDGTVVVQDLGTSRSVQSIDVDVVTETVRLRIVSVSSQARGPQGRDYTAVSTVRLLGTPAPATR
ncbi:MAG: hypothetical protein JWN84_4308 [Nocardioides sp.]|nr:hypothetical protein [Nocardioides sp.]